MILSEIKKKLELFPKYALNFFFSNKNITSFDEVFYATKQLLSKKVISETIERLSEDTDLNTWVKHGFDLHRTKKEKEKCLFCQKTLDVGFLESLGRHFSEDYEKLQSEIKTFISELENLKREIYDEDTFNLYSDMRNDYQKYAKDINNVIHELNEWIIDTMKKLEEKLNSPLMLVWPPAKPTDYKTSCNNIIEELNTIITNHNKKVDNYDDEVRSAKEKIEHHLIAVSIEEQDYKMMKKELENCIKAERNAKSRLDSNAENIRLLEQETSNIGMAVKKINKHLEEFFGRKEIQLELDDRKKGYIIKRNGQPAKNLSEGEKTAIAFSYFIVKVEEKDFKINEGIIFIDDPISSFDSSFIYHCFSLIKNHFRNSGQLFIFTHNFTLFNLVKAWFKNKESEYYMIENIIKDNNREAYLKPLEKTLKEYKTEYNFLFSRLHCFLDNDAPEYADFYTIGNIARRFLEAFTNFKIPTSGDFFSKIDQLNTGDISDTEKGKVYRLIQEFSHGSDTTNIIEHKDKSGCQEAVRVLMEIVKHSDHKHYESLEKSLP